MPIDFNLKIVMPDVTLFRVETFGTKVYIDTTISTLLTPTLCMAHSRFP